MPNNTQVQDDLGALLLEEERTPAFYLASKPNAKWTEEARRLDKDDVGPAGSARQQSSKLQKQQTFTPARSQ